MPRRPFDNPPLILALVTLLLAGPVGAVNIQGSLEDAGNPMWGWAVDLDAQNASLRIDFYIDGPIGTGRLMASSVANRPRTDLNKNGVVGDHGFFQFVPSRFKDGRAHSIYAYAVSGSASLLLTGDRQSNTYTCSVFHCPPPPVGTAPGSAMTVQAVGDWEQVFDYALDQCGPEDNPDAPTRAYRDAAGAVHLIAPHMSLYRSSGSSLDTVKRQCQPVFTSAKDRVYENARYAEWLTSPYTLDGKNVYGLVHNEWYAAMIDPKCAANPYSGWLNFITTIQSTDGGATFTHPADYILVKPAVPWSTSYPCSTSYGGFEPSNIIQKEGYYYAFFRSAPDPTGQSPWGTCLMRTPNLADTASWTVWTPNGWKSPRSSQCSAIQSDVIETMHESVTWNAYLGLYVLIGEKWAPTKGIYVTTSRDLLTWTPAVKLANVYTSANYKMSYASLLDPSDTSRNFETTGREPYLYYVVDYGNGDRDLLRQKLRFTTGAPPSSINPAAPVNLRTTN